ncbi:MAG: M56 family metallopeptidase [Chitinophagaceae bacterium]
MEIFFHHIIFQSLGWAMLNSLFLGLCIFLLVRIIQSFTSNAANKYLLYLIAEFSLAIFFIITFFTNYFRPPVDHSWIQNNFSPATIGTTGLQVYVANLFDPTLWNNVCSILAVAYFIGLIIFTARWTFSWRATQKLRNTSNVKAGVQLRIFTLQAAGQMNIKRTIQLYVSKLAKSPMTIGFLKPVILLPIAGINHLTQEQLEAVILHELAHIQRADYLLNILQSIAEAILFFNPFSHILSKYIHLERENSCDDWVMQYQYQPALYANALLKIAKLQAAPVLALSAAGKKGQLKIRVQRLFSSSPKKSYKLLVGMIACLCFVIFLRVQFFQHNEKNVISTSPVFKTIQDDGLMNMRFSNIKDAKTIIASNNTALKKATAKKEKSAQKKVSKNIYEVTGVHTEDQSQPEMPVAALKEHTKLLPTGDSRLTEAQDGDKAEMNVVFQSVKLMLDSLNKVSNQLDKSEITSLASTDPMQISRAAYTFNTKDSSLDNAMHEAIILVTKIPANSKNEINYQVEIMGNNGKIISYTVSMKVYQ